MRSSSVGTAGGGGGGVGKGAIRVATGVERDEVVAIDGGCIKMTGITGLTGLGVVVLLSGVGVRLVVVSGVGVDANVSRLAVSSDEVKDEVEMSDSSSNDSLSSGSMGILRGRSSGTMGIGSTDSQSMSEGSYTDPSSNKSSE